LLEDTTNLRIIVIITTSPSHAQPHVLVDNIMPSLLLVVFLVELAVHVVNTIGAATINNLVYTHAA